MTRPSFLAPRRHAGSLLILASLSLASLAVHATDTYDGATLTIPTLTIGAATYSNVVVSGVTIASPPSGSAPNGSVDTYDPVQKLLTVQSVTFGGKTYNNLVVRVANMVSIGAVTGADSYTSGKLFIPQVTVGSSTYSNVRVSATPADVRGVGGGLPRNAMDQYSPSSGDLLIAAVEVGQKVYTNVTVALTLADVDCINCSPTPPTYTVSGRVIGLASGQSLQLVNGQDSLPVTSSGAFTLPTAITTGTAYSVVPGTLPAGQSCAVQNGSGTIAAVNVTNVLVYCTYNQSVATLNGTYGGGGFNISKNTDSLGTGSFGGNGIQGAISGYANSAGTTFVPVTQAAGDTYTVVTTNAIPVLTTGGNNIGAIAGADGDEFMWLANAGPPNPAPAALAVWVRPMQNATTAALAGNWYSVALTEAAVPYVGAGLITINADGSGSYAATTLDTTGTVSTQSSTAGPGSFTLDSTGLISAGGNDGYLSTNGEFLMLSFVGTPPGTPLPGGASANYPGLTAAVKLGSGVTLATLNGVYTIGSLAFTGGTNSDGKLFTLLFDGAGNYSGTYIEDNNGTASTGTASGTYTVTSTGLLTLTGSQGNLQSGAISADGKLFVSANLTGGGAEKPRISVGFRQ